ncbi:hypothetical protein BDN71DRAFT_1018086 [Pleurotus eryngii]|uniref:Uncharacterized protein n=1 Tax=Pleurotus eryngii TaxID=5323 RepID=A0A9P5ZUZ2_PLEER|nr:hypothetical protein BDN71DRAFT_1018086 [Pleurotus eryngii]
MSSVPPICSITPEQKQKWLPKMSRYYVPDHICPFTHMCRGVLQGVLKFNMWFESSIIILVDVSSGRIKTGIPCIHPSSELLPIAQPSVMPLSVSVFAFFLDGCLSINWPGWYTLTVIRQDFAVHLSHVHIRQGHTASLTPTYTECFTFYDSI